MKTLIKKAALDLIQRNQMTTTLEVKEELIATEPMYFWRQDFVSTTLREFADNGELQFKDNGTFRVYMLPSSVAMFTASSNSSKYRKIPFAQRTVAKVSLTELAKLVEENAGKFVGLVHTKRTTGQQNTMNCQVLKGLTPLGAIQVKEQGQLKTIYPTDLLEVRLKSVIYQLK